jgi:hypothetical protein
MSAGVERPVFATDVTHLIAADSYLRRRTEPLRWISAASDPGAEDSFRVLCDLLTNDTLIHFWSRADLRLTSMPLIKAWKAVAERLCEDGAVSSHPEPSGINVSAESLCGDTIDPFAFYIEEAGVADRLLRFAEFQFSRPDLMDLFWPNNPASDWVDIVSNAVMERYGAIPAAFRSAWLKTRPPELDPISRAYLGNHAINAELFIVSWLFWTFMKGRAYASTLTPHHVYSVHWLRERAIQSNARALPDTISPSGQVFQWSGYVSSLVLHEEFAFDTDQIVEMILSLRSYTATYLASADANTLQEFAVEGLLQSLPRRQRDYVGSAVGALGLAAALPIGPQTPVDIVELIVAALALVQSPAKDRLNDSVERIRMLRAHRSTIRSIVEAEDRSP